jgi:hypothetical protein
LKLAMALKVHDEAPWQARMQEAVALGKFDWIQIQSDEVGGSRLLASCELLDSRRQRLVDITTRGTWALAQSEGAANARR